MNNFILLGLGRCGSNLVKKALNQNTRIFMGGELYNRNVFPESKNTDGEERAKQFYIENSGSAVEAVGFKLFLHQGQKGAASSVWTYLQNCKDIRILRLTRKNYFERILSLEVARKTKKWATRKVKEDAERDGIRIDHSIEWWQEKLVNDENMNKELDGLFQDHFCAHYFYEDIVENWNKEMDDIQGFLGVQKVELTKELAKQETIKPSVRLSNYDDVAAHFAGSRFGWMFES